MATRECKVRLFVLGCMIAVFGCAQVPDTILQRSTQTAMAEVTPAEASPTHTESATLEVPTATAIGPPLPLRHLTICTGAQPESLFIYSASSQPARKVLEAIYDGPIDRINYEYQPVILEKIPSLADGDAEIRVVTVVPGQEVVDANGEVVILSEEVRVRPIGCRRDDCTITFDGSSPLEMGQMVVTFRILEDLKWEDGEPLTAEDSVFSFRYAQECSKGMVWREECSIQSWIVSYELFKRTAEYTALDARTNQWVGLPGFLSPDYQLSFYHPLPKHKYSSLLSDHTLETEELELKPLGWGPYRIIKWDIGKEIRLEKNPYYFRANEGLPYFDTLTFRYIGYSEENIKTLQEGTCDLLDSEAIQNQPIENLKKAKEQGDIKLYYPISSIWNHLTLNFVDDHPYFFVDLRTRKEIAYCLDRPRIIDEVFFDLSEIPALYVPASHPVAPAGVAPIPYDPECGEALLTEAGWIDHDQDPATSRIADGVVGVRDGTPFRINYWTTNADVRKQVSEILAESLAECGIQVDLAYWTSGEFFAESPDAPLSGKTFDLAQFAWVSGPFCDLYLSSKIPGDPELLNPDGSVVYPAGWNGVNVGSYQNPAYDAACESARAALPGEPEYQVFHQQAMQIYMEDLPSIPLYYSYDEPYSMASRADMCGVIFDSTARSSFSSIESFDYGESCHP